MRAKAAREKANPVVRAASKRPLPEICPTSSANTNNTRENTPVTNNRVLSLVDLGFKADVAPAFSKPRVCCSGRWGGLLTRQVLGLKAGI